MHFSGIGQTVYGPQLPCCPNAEAAANSTLVGGPGPSCDPNCLEGDTTQQRLETANEYLAAMVQSQYTEASRPRPGIPWYLWAAAGFGAVLLIKGSSR